MGLLRNYNLGVNSYCNPWEKKINMRKYKFFLFLSVMVFGLSAMAEEQDIDMQYRRGSLCSFLVSRTDQNLHDKIQTEFLNAETPSQYNNHDLAVRLITVDKKGNYASDIDQWLESNYVASRLVGKWFDRNIWDGSCSLDLVKARGLYNATEFDRELASRSARGMAMLEDAGEDLIGNTFVLVHEAHYIDNAKRSKNVATGMRIAGALLGAFLGSGVSDLMDTAADLAQTFKGFRVKFHTRLYQLVWDEGTASDFYNNMYTSSEDPVKTLAFNQNRGKFKLKYIGEVESSGSKNSFLGISEEHPEIMIRKACQRAIDDNIRDLQREYESFRVKSPITGINGDEVLVPIGLKEGVSLTSEYEVLEPQDKNGKIEYKRVGTITPVNGRIWDNRYMAREEGAVGSDLTATTFTVKSGKTPYPGLLVRQIK